MTGSTKAWAPWIATAILAMLLGAWVALRVDSGRGRLAAHAASAVRVPAGEASPPTFSDADAALGQPEEGLPPTAKIPDRLPEFSLSDASGRSTSIAAWSGKSLILNFWATWCAPCRHEIPLLETLSGEWATHDIQVVGIAVDHRDQVLAYARELKIPYPLLLGEQDALDVAAKLGMDAPVFPFTVFTDRRGNIVTLYVGELHKAQAELILAAVQDINEKRLDLSDAERNIASGLKALAAARSATGGRPIT